MGKATPKGKRGFTLIELMIAVVIIGVLASVSLPAFQQYSMKAKTAELPGNIGVIFRGAQTYWNAPYVNSRNLTATAKGHCMPTACCGGVDSTMPPLPPTPEKRIVDLSAMQATTKLAAEAIGFLPSDPLYGAYAWGTPFGDVTTCNVTEADFPDGWAMVIFAATDLDGDGIMGGMSMQIGIRGEDLYRAPGYGTVGDGLRQLYDMDCPGCGDFAE